MAQFRRSLQCPDVGERPHQPRDNTFEILEFVKTKKVRRSFQRGWFDRWPWLHWDKKTTRSSTDK